MPLIGVGVGLYLSMAEFNREVERQLARSPGEFVCGNPAIPFLVLGLIGGALGGIVAGRAVAGLVTSLARRCGYQVVTEGNTLDKGTLTDELIATESKRKVLRSDVDLVERLIAQAESGRDEEVARKLLDYRAELERHLEL
jgi:hypothetical protein